MQIFEKLVDDHWDSFYAKRLILCTVLLSKNSSVTQFFGDNWVFFGFI
ncbi:hypothetical protein RV07_GL001798 [Enterococcus malodoratus]|nr:hypothetical protein RV07_GL001798 [Enterococcus malodoratus]